MCIQMENWVRKADRPEGVDRRKDWKRGADWMCQSKTCSSEGSVMGAQ